MIDRKTVYSALIGAVSGIIVGVFILWLIR